jgi:polysaccharide deacetylase family protein (PEP-CTERM system associated)
MNTQVLEVPIATARLFRTNLPAGGGGYFRLMPYAVSRWLIQRVNSSDEEAAIFYFHPWEIDPEQPRVNGVDAKTRFRHYVHLERTEKRLRLLLQDFHWDRMDHVVFGTA